MSLDDFLSRLEGVRRQGRGYVARCVSHDDQRPSLSIHEGDQGLLVRCWSGCRTEDIVAALGLTMKDLFYASRATIDRTAVRRRRQKQAADAAKKRERGRRLDAYREADTVLRELSSLDISKMTDEQVDRALTRACNARTLLAREET